MGKNTRKNLIALLLCVGLAALFSAVTLFAVNSFAGKDKAVPFSEKVVLNLRESKLAEPCAEEAGVGVMLRYAETFTCNHGEISSEKELLKHRQELKAYYEKRNEDLFESLNLSDCVTGVYSDYGPFIEYRYKTADDFFKSDFKAVQAADCALLETVYIDENDCSDDATRNNSRSTYPFKNALRDVGIDDSKQFTGNGVKVGIIESGVPDNLVNLAGVTYETFGEALTSHSFQTSSIIGTGAGIASDAELYFGALTNKLFVECGDWMVEKGVTVINRSNGGKTGTYTGHSAYADYLVRQQKITFINSAGNDGDTNIIGYPSTGLNVISVASNDWNKAISNFSSAGMASGQTISLAKPTLTAPGGSLSGIKNISGAISGTSFSTPITTGLVALLMEEFPELKYQPEKVMALLTNSCTPAKGQTEIWDHDAGFGIVNYTLARENYENLRTFTTPNATANAAAVICESAVSIPFGGTLKAKAAVLFNSTYSTTPSNGNFSPSQVPYSDIKMELLRGETGEVVASGNTISNLTFVEFTNETYQVADWTCDFKLRVYLNAAKSFTGEEPCALTFRIEEDEPFGLVFSDGRYWEDGAVVEGDFYYEVFAAGCEIDEIYVYAPDGEEFVSYENKAEIPLGSCAGDYVFYFEYYDNDGNLENSYELTVCLNAVSVELFRGGESVYTCTILGSDPQVDSELTFYWDETLKISATAPDGVCNLELNEDILLTREEYDEGEYEIYFSFYSGEELSVIIHILHYTPKLVVDGKTYGDGEAVTVKESLVLDLSICDEGSGAYIKITDENGEEVFFSDTPTDSPITLSAELGAKKVYTVEMCDEFGDVTILTVTVDNVPEQGGIATIILVIALVLVIVGVTVLIIIIYRKKRKKGK